MISEGKSRNFVGWLLELIEPQNGGKTMYKATYCDGKVSYSFVADSPLLAQIRVEQYLERTFN